MKSEDKIQAEIVSYFNESFPSYRTCLVRLKNERSTTYDIALGIIPGAADLLLTLGNGYFCWIETKTEKGKQSPQQIKFQQEHEKIGNKYYIVRSLEDFIDVLRVEMGKDKIVEDVRQDLHQRSQTGITKYGTTLENNGGDNAYWLQHAYEEALDLALYLKKLININRTK